ncbi:MAG TPA: TetR/AcrR family transcriptional regulator [Acidimicrobiales bacterium]|jgi:AcrR family transcriptional regulator|nr:TetR/AcrR family transcriptional regulator [Acidimicrobiales bacterium]
MTTTDVHGDPIPRDPIPGGQSAKPGRPRSEAREQAILDAALELVVEVGYDKLSMDALAERAHASKATIYRHWSGKAEVVAAAVRCRAEESMEFTPDTGSLRGDLISLLDHSCETLAAEDGALMAAVLWAMRTDPVLAGLMRAQMVDGKRDVVRGVVERAVARGECPGEVDPAAAGEVMPAMVLSRLLVTGEPLDRAFSVHLVDDVMLPLLR